MDKKISVSALGGEVRKILKDFSDEKMQDAERGLDEAEQILVSALKAASPVKTGKYRTKWKGSGRKTPGRRIISNPTQVKSGNRKLPLSNILEYSTEHGHPFIKSTFEKVKPRLANAMEEKIK